MKQLPGASHLQEARPHDPIRPTVARRAAIAVVIVGVIGGALWVRQSYSHISSSRPEGTAAPERITASDDVVLDPAPPVLSSDEAGVAAQIRAARIAAPFKAQSVGYSDLIDRGRAAARTGELLSAERSLAKAVAHKPDAGPVVYDLLARCQVELGLFERAKSTCAEAIRRYPSNVLAYVGLSRAFEGLGQTERRAAPLLDAARAIAPSDEAAHIYLATEFDKLRDLPRALEQAKLAVGARPEDPAAEELVAGLLFKLRRFDEARTILEGVLKSNPRDAAAHRILGQILDSPQLPNRDRPAAESHYLQALKITGPEADTLWRLGQLYMDQGRTKPAAYLFIQVLKLSPNSAAVRAQLARAYEKLGDRQAAAEQTRLSKELLASDTKATELTAERDRKPADPAVRIKLAKFYRSIKQYRLALAEGQAAVSLAPNSADARSELVLEYRSIGLDPPAET